MRDAERVGVLNCGNGFEDVWVLTDTCELMVSENIMGNLLISPIVVEGATGFSSPEVAESICEELKVDGAVLTIDFLITFKNGKAQYRHVTNPTVIVKTEDYDTDICVEENIRWFRESV